MMNDVCSVIPNAWCTMCKWCVNDDDDDDDDDVDDDNDDDDDDNNVWCVMWCVICDT